MHSLQTCLFKYITVSAFAFMLSVVKMPLKGKVGGYGNNNVDHGKNHGIVLLNFCGNPVKSLL